MVEFHVGTSGFSYDEWRPAFYPDDLPQDQMLAFFAQRLRAVEINNTFYRMPKSSVVANWAAAVPDGFRFAIKASKRIASDQRLVDCGEICARLFKATSELGAKLGCLFYQVPKWVHADAAVLKDFLALHPPPLRIAFEFAHASWLQPPILEQLAAHDAALVLSDKDDAETPALQEHGTWFYLRLRRTNYNDDDLRAWRARIEQRGPRTCFLFFKHEDECAGPRLAQRFDELAP